jgi:hypothetical protein
MAAQVIDANSLLVKTDQQALTVAWLNNLISQFCFAINGIGVRMDGYDAAEQNLVNLGLANINSVLGPFLTTLQEAAQLGFLVAQADGRSLSLTIGQPFDMILTSNGASMFTPTQWLMVMDVADSTNWGVLSLDSWVQEDLNLAAHCIYASKTKASSSWQVTCGSGILNAMINDMNVATSAAATAQTAANTAQQGATTVTNALASAGQAGVQSINGKTGFINQLAEADIANLTSDLSARPTTSYVNSVTAGLQPHSANLDQLTSSTLTAFGFALFGAANAAAALATLGAVGSSSPAFSGAPTAPTQVATDNSTRLATTAFVNSAISASVPSGMAPLASPAFTGTPTAPTPAPGNNSTALGTTAFVWTALGNYVTTAALNAATISSTQIAAVFDDQTGTSYTMAAGDNGRAVTFTNSAASTVTLPNNLAKGWNVVCWQGGAGQVTFSPASGATLVNRQSKTKTAGQYAMVTLMVMSNSSGTNATYALGGDAA